WSHNIRQPKSATSSSVGGHTAERVEHSDMVFVKDLDATSPKLWEACSAGYTFDEVQIDFYRANGDKRIKYLQIKLKHVLVSSVTPTVNEEGVPTEAFGLKYAAVEWTYNQQDINGTAKGAVTKKWSLSNNTASYAA
ncbi:Hcp family type VI secretion system effector, partial [Acinetobacter baumannii]|nr:type VI secretion system tube protein Hcp [Acinetobacter baumannii]